MATERHSACLLMLDESGKHVLTNIATAHTGSKLDGLIAQLVKEKKLPSPPRIKKGQRRTGKVDEVLPKYTLHSNREFGDPVIELTFEKFVTCKMAMLKCRDEVCRFFDDTFGIMEAKTRQSLGSGYTIPDDVYCQLLEYAADTYNCAKKKKMEKKCSRDRRSSRDRYEPKSLENTPGNAHFGRFGPSSHSFVINFTCFQRLAGLKEDGAIDNVAIDLYFDLLNLSLGHAPNDNIYPDVYASSCRTATHIPPNATEVNLRPLLHMSKIEGQEQLLSDIAVKR